ncbi:TlpA family protein disulfide reductase [Mucilaginibacter sp. FT3.2]|uniref:TlpA family protein disulfide reductase n=1 Tax=Mucilaginibacter sp. FT3.2 TaxID=2723090 RepID=UPI001608B9B8|nr:TlpA disulfide reductase family protein [Mucilaginibacter sp. FT3.2]MBB6230536.1 thiol-disulfide isomerase/thioredoxin [Mucilaginibacter sp. FT3.2]
MNKILKIIKSNIIFIAMMILVIITIVNPTAKSYLIRGLMAVGMFQPDPTEYAHHHEAFANLPDYRYRDTNGDTIAISNLKNKVVFVNYWATWCPPCLAEMPSINNLRQKFKNNPQVVFIMVDADNNTPKANAFLQKNNYDLPLYTSVNAFPDTLLDGSIPTTLIFGKDGSLKYKRTGAADYNTDKFREFLEKEASPNPLQRREL